MRKVFKYPSVIESEGAMYSDVKNVLMEAKVERRRLFSIMLAVSEAFTNALIHGNQFVAGKQIEVSITVNNDTIVADIIDEGEGYIANMTSINPVDEMSEGGRGVGLMNSFADEIKYFRGSNQCGTRVSMRFNRNVFISCQKNASNMEGKMESKRRDEGQVVIIYLSGRLDLSSGNKLKEEVKGILNSGKPSVHLNLKDVEFVNSSGLGALVSIMKETRIHRGRLTLSDMADYVREIFDITQLSHIFEIFATEQEALRSYQPATVG
jgi:anti-anti-sigma factor